MKEKIFNALKQEYKALGLSDEILQGHANALAAIGLVTDENLSAVVDVWLIVPCHNSNIAGLDIRFFSDSEARETLPVFVFVRQVIVCFKRNEFAIFQVSKASPRPTKAVVSCTHAQRNNIFILLQNASRSLKILPKIHRHILIFSLPLFPSLSYRNWKRPYRTNN